jgi:arsenate reductase
MTDAVMNVLILCTGNSARSSLGEALLNHLGDGHFRAYSAGSTPAGQVNPFTLEVLAANGIPIDGLASKSWDVFAEPGAPEMDLVITVCDNAAGEVCPVWPGHPAQVHWGFPDPAACTGDDDEKRAAFAAVFAAVRAQVQRLVDTPLGGLDVAGRVALLRSMAPDPDMTIG